MARSDDDREEAPGWYARWRLEQEEQLGEERMAEIRKVLGGGDANHGKQILHQMRNARGVGFLGLIKLADVLGERSPGMLLDHALAWWERSGRAYRDRKVAEGPRRRKTKSGQYPSVSGSTAPGRG